MHRDLLRLLTLTCLFTPTLAQEREFEVIIENVSADTAFPTPLAPGVWAVHDSPGVLFLTDAPDPGDGLEALAEDGDPGLLADSLSGRTGVTASGTFAVPEGAVDPSPAFPGGAYRFRITAGPEAPYLSLATMIVQSNDLFIAPDPVGLRLFDESGQPLGPGDRTAEMEIWDAGTEVNEAPGAGPSQAPRQSGPDRGETEGGVFPFTASTRALPLAPDLVGVEVVSTDAGYSITIANRSADAGALVTPIAPVFFAVHDSSWSLFELGAEASSGLEALAEDGGPGALVAETTGTPGVLHVGAQPITDQRPGDDPGPAGPGESYTFELPLLEGDSYLTLALMVVQTNDAFIAPGPAGIPLRDSEGEPLAAAALEDELRRRLAVWDAGTEANQVPGVGLDQAPRQSGPDTGDADPVSGVRLYRDATSDLAGEIVGRFTDLTITPVEGGSFEIRLRNQSEMSAYPGVLTPLFWTLHDASVSLFQVGEPASEALEKLAEDGDPSALVESIQGLSGFQAGGVVDMPEGSDGPGPLTSGNEYVAVITPVPEAPYLSLATMVVPSSDTFLAPGPSGIRLLDEQGQPRSAEELAAEVRETFIAWDAGTERNSSGAGGRDQAPRQAGPDTGVDEGNGLVRRLDDSVWGLPPVEHLFRVTVRLADEESASFLRGDANGDEILDMTDSMMGIGYLFLGDPAPPCLDVLDVDDSGRLNITDPIVLLRYLFLGGTRPPEPGVCGLDPTADDLACEGPSSCD